VTILWSRTLRPVQVLRQNRDEPLQIFPARAHFAQAHKEARLSESEPIAFSPRRAGTHAAPFHGAAPGREGPATVAFNRHELNEILAVYGRKVAAGEWRDYAIDLGRERAVFSVFRRSSEVPLYRIEKAPRLARKQGAYAVVAATGLILKRGHELRRVLSVLERGVHLVEA
jgi:hypothetical protein